MQVADENDMDQARKAMEMSISFMRMLSTTALAEGISKLVLWKALD
ncbi:hypothetical protein N9362_00160 [bacterium]|nr:hypothetical protein [bacterium]